MKLIQHVAISIGVSALVWAVFRSSTAAADCFLTGVFLDIDHLLDYVINYGPRFKIKHFFTVFEFEAIENIYLFLHSWEFIVIYLALLWLIDWKPVAIGAVIGIVLHLLLDHFFNAHGKFAYFISYRLFHRFSGRHFYGEKEYHKRTERQKNKGFITT